MREANEFQELDSCPGRGGGRRPPTPSLGSCPLELQGCPTRGTLSRNAAPFAQLPLPPPCIILFYFFAGTGCRSHAQPPPKTRLGGAGSYSASSLRSSGREMPAGTTALVCLARV